MNRFAKEITCERLAGSGERFFTVEEANRALVLVKRIVEDVVAGYVKLVDLQEIIDSAQSGGVEDHATRAQEEIVQVAERLQICAQEMEDVGADLKDWSLGIVDFPCRIGGQRICLCWQLGEPRVEFYHEADQGFAERQPIETLLAGETLASHK